MISYELVAIFTQLHSPETRVEGVARLATYCGVTRVMLFGKDNEVGVFLPAQGLPQTLPRGINWNAFLNSCTLHGTTRGTTPDENAAETNFLGITDAEGLAVIVFFGATAPPAELSQVRALLPALGAKLAIELSVLAAGGHAAAARESSRLAGALNNALDINRRQLQEAYQRAERELESRRIAESKLREADRRKDEFLAMLAHELRNPLAPIGMAAQILKIGAANPVRLQQTSEIIDRQVSHMTCLLDDLLDVSRVTGGMVVLSQDLHDMRAIVNDAVEQARPLINARTHSITLNMPDCDAAVYGDGTRLVQIVTNLLNNSAKYTSSGGEIVVTLDLREEEVVLTVLDDGIGIDPGLLPHIFDLFTQGERSSDRSQGGLGLGLALVRSLAERHGGAVTARSAGRGMGSEFEVTLPRARPIRSPADSESLSDDVNSDSLRILVVDDNEDAAQMLAQFLEANGHRVSIAFRGDMALAMATVEAPHVLVLDIGLPDMDGHQLARRLRVLDATRGSTFIALTGYGRPEDRASSLEAGFDYHLTKPVNPLELIQLIGSVSIPPSNGAASH